MLTLTKRLPIELDQPVSLTLALTADERTRSWHRFETMQGQEVLLRLSRGTVLQEGDLLQTAAGDQIIQICAQPEPVLTVKAQPLDLLRAAYHLGNRHVSLEINSTYLRLAPDSVLKAMLEQLDLEVTAEIAPFHPELGAYHSIHGH